MAVLPPHIKAAINRFAYAARRYGAMEEASAQPDNHYSIATQYERARESLERAIEKVIDR